MHEPEKPARKYIYKMWTLIQEKTFHMEESFFEEETLYFSMQKVSVTRK